MTAHQRWHEALWPKLRSYLPPPPAVIWEIGCGRHGGFVPRLLAEGYEAVGIDPVAPEGERYRRVVFEHSDPASGLDGVIACTSLHHVGQPSEVLGKVADALAPGGVVVVVEWDWEEFDEATANWCFERLGSESESWLHRRRDEWRASGRPWEQQFRSWAEEHGIHSARRLLHDLDHHFERVLCQRGPYFFVELDQTTEADELATIDSGTIRPGRIDYVGRRR